MSRTFSPLFRLWQIRRVIKRQGLGDLLDELNLSKGARLLSKLLFGFNSQVTLARAIRIRQALEELGPIFIKFGQALSTRPDLLPDDIALELTRLQDRVPPFPNGAAMQIIRDAFGDQFDDVFESIEPQPIASASVAQVHAAKLQAGKAICGKNGVASEQVIVKVLRPEVHKVIERDLAVMYLLAGLLQKYWSLGQQFKPLEVIADYDKTIHGELDLRQEAANCSQMGANFADNEIIYVPSVYWDYTNTQVMVMERIYGTTVRDVDKLVELGYDLKQLAADGVETFFKQAFEDNFFHADMHPGNIFVSDKGRWIAVDFGIMGVLAESDKRYLAEMLLGFFNRDYRAIADSYLRAEWVPADTNIAEFEAAIRKVCEPNFAKPISEISFGLVLMQLFQTVRRFEMPAQPQLVLLYKTLLNIEGLGRQLYPQLNLWDTAKPFLENWMKQQLSPQALLQDLKRDWPRWRGVLTELPDQLLRLGEQSTQDQKRHDDYLALLSSQAQKNRRVTFHQLLGFITAITGSVILTALHSGLIGASNASDAAPWLIGGGLMWAYFQSR